MANLKLYIPDGPAGFSIAGKVFPAGAGPNTPPVIPDVLTARNDAGTEFKLGSGSYVYEFHVEKGDGKFTVKIDNTDTKKNCGSDDFDTATDGKNALDLSFKVERVE